MYNPTARLSPAVVKRQRPQERRCRTTRPQERLRQVSRRQRAQRRLPARRATAATNASYSACQPRRAL